MNERKIDYKSSGIDYESIDPLKTYAQSRALASSDNLKRHGFAEMEGSRGESAYVFDMGEVYGAVVVEGLGTKNLILGEYMSDNREYWKAVSHDTVAMIVNDMVTVGAMPVVVSPHWASGSSEWFQNEDRWKGLVDGWSEACEEVGASYAAGETAALPGIISIDTVELSGSAFGVIDPKDRLVLGNEIVPTDRIVLVESNGIHANGLSLARKLASDKLPDKYDTRLSGDLTYGSSLLKPTHLYPKLVENMFDEQVDVHYMVNVTGHGWRKLMRAKGEFTYRMQFTPPVYEEFDLIQKNAGLSDSEMYATFNMGAGFAFVVSNDSARKAVEVANDGGYDAWDAGLVEKGPKRVIIEPKNVIFDEKSMNIR